MYFIAEIGINHNGKLSTALELIKQAHLAGCNMVKFQKRNPDLCVPEEQKNKKKIFQGQEMTYLEYKKLLEFDKNNYDIINEYCHNLNIDWTASVWDTDSVDFMAQYKNDVPFVKIPSACITNKKIIEKINQYNFNTIISNGMSTQVQVDEAIKLLNNNLFGILHCNSSYPSIDNELDLNVIKTYKQLYPKITIGYSGHEQDYLPTIIAASFGAVIIERHITLDRTMEGTDQAASLDIKMLNELMSYLQRIPIICGDNQLHIYPSEQMVAKKLRGENF